MDDEPYGAGLLDCFGSVDKNDCCANRGDLANCCLVFWCPSCAVGKLAARAPLDAGFPGSGSFVMPCLLSHLLKPFACADVCLLSMPMRKGFAPPEYVWDPTDECYLTCYCGPCALCQELNLTDRRLEAGKPAWQVLTHAPNQKRMTHRAVAE